MNDKPDSFRRKNFFIIDKIFLENNDDNVLTIQSIKCECDNGSILDLKGWHDIESIYPGKAVNATLGVRINSIDQVDTAERCEVRISFHDWKNPIVCKLHPPQDDH